MRVGAAWPTGARASGSLDLLLRCSRGSRPSAALQQGVSTCCCAASACAVPGRQKGLDRAAGDGAGLGSRAAARARSGRKVLRWLRDPVENAEAFRLGRANEESWVASALGGRTILPLRGPFHANAASLGRSALYRWICNRRSASAVAGPPIGRANAERWVKNAETKNLASRASSDQTPRPETGPRPAAGRGPLGGRPSVSRGSAPARPGPPAAAHQRARTPCGSAPARSRHPQAAHHQGHDTRPQTTVSGSSFWPVGPIWMSVPIWGQTPQS